MLQHNENKKLSQKTSRASSRDLAAKFRARGFQGRWKGEVQGARQGQRQGQKQIQVQPKRCSSARRQAKAQRQRAWRKKQAVAAAPEVEFEDDVKDLYAENAMSAARATILLEKAKKAGIKIATKVVKKAPLFKEKKGS